MTTTTTLSQDAARPSSLPVVALAIALGLGLLTVSGVAQATVLHDAAHDQRHAMAFPCH